ALDRYIPLRSALTRLRRTGPCVVERRHDAAPTQPPGGVAPLVSRRVPCRIPPAHRHPASSRRPAPRCRSRPPCNLTPAAPCGKCQPVARPIGLRPSSSRGTDRWIVLRHLHRPRTLAVVTVPDVLDRRGGSVAALSTHRRRPGGRRSGSHPARRRR